MNFPNSCICDICIVRILSSSDLPSSYLTYNSVTISSILMCCLIDSVAEA